nr:PREDICTED: uncharacterized protein LOC108227482 [Daucus carota subsp. sativus]
MTLPSARMATSEHSPKKSPSKDDGGDQEIRLEKLEEQEESSLKKIDDIESEVAKASDEITKPSTAVASEEETALNTVTADTTVVGGGDSVAAEEESGRERLRKHRLEMAGRVWIPDTWGQEDLLKDWIDCSAFDGSLVNNTILSARAALIQQRSTTSPANNPTLLTAIDNSDETSN